MDKLNIELKKQAIAYGLCEKWTNDWSENRSKQELIDMWLRGLDFSIENDYPTNEFIKEHFEPELLKENHIFVDSPFHGVNLDKKVVVCGKSDGVLEFDKYATCDVYVRHESHAHVQASGCSKVFINLYDGANITIKQMDMAKVYIYLHGSYCHVQYEGEVFVRNSR